ncbi:nickel-dependent hydrogenase cytochrome b-type subunit [Endozoicomonas sp. OPT23]|uniref:cytochrome b/b6 domain-containing protein n=1 Tax=Endozoicomonas sp. OPT23 TaxID=2072845 RepID=UPI00129C0DC6|nr:cytochrome b/b6 domain-containing protein [Endozoicomonas sp. OPT23]MRI32242.1 nickel-dependent hydrogenase cytochrome b-type subunit [Endozoicomonas sp. OPT23]
MSNSMSDSFRWPRLVQFIHWSVATLFLANHFVTEGGDELHEYFGWSILALIGLRIGYGLLLAPEPAKISSMTTSPAKIREHLEELKAGDVPELAGHNPLGVIAVWLMWFSLAGAAFTGWLQDTDFGFDYVVYEWHSWLVDGLLIFAAIHLAAVVLTSWRSRKNLIKTML